MKKPSRWTMALCLAALAACGGGGGGGGGGSGSGDPPELGVLFPPPVSLTESADSIMVRGTSKNAVTVTVNGTNAELASNGDWSIRAPLVEGDNTLEVFAKSKKGETVSTQAKVRNVSFIPDYFDSIAWDPDNERLYGVSARKLARYDAASKEWRRIDLLESVSHVLWDSANRRMLVRDSSGQVHALSADGTEVVALDNVKVSVFRAWRFDPLGQRLVLLRSSLGTLTLSAVSLMNGAETLLFSDSENNLRNNTFAFDPADEKTWFAHTIEGKIFEYNLATEELRVISDSGNTGDGPILGQVRAMLFVPESSALAVSYSEKVIGVDVASGTREILSESGTRGDGPALRSVDWDGVTRGNTGNIWLSNPSMDHADGVVRVDLQTGNRYPLRSERFLRGNGSDLAEFRVGSLGGGMTERQELLVPGTHALLGVDLATGDRRVLSGENVGAGPRLGGVSDTAIDAEGRTLAVTTEGLFRIDIESGDREQIELIPYDGNTPSPGRLDSMVFDETRNIALINDVLNRAILAADLSTGVYRVFSTAGIPGVPDSKVGEGDIELGAGSLVLTKDGLLFRGGRRIVKIDRINGNRTLLTNNIPIGDYRYEVLPSGEILTTDFSQHRLVKVSPANGEITEVSRFSVIGTGPAFLNPVAVLSTGEAVHAVLDTQRYALFIVDGISGDRVIVSR